MSGSENISAELQEISPLLNRIDRHLPLYAVPDGYFAGLALQILERVRTSAGEVPAGYFDQFAGSMMARIRAMEAAEKEVPALEASELPSLLESISRTNPYRVPVGYFEALPTQLLEAVQEKRKAKVVSFSAKWMRYAAAAAVAGIITTITVLNIGRHTDAVPVSQIASIPDQEIINYLQEQDLPITDPASKVVASADFSDNDIKDLFSDVSDSELEQYSKTQDTPQKPVTN